MSATVPGRPPMQERCWENTSATLGLSATPEREYDEGFEDVYMLRDSGQSFTSTLTSMRHEMG